MPEGACRPELQRIIENTPECLRQRPQWVCWKYVTREGKPTKCPVSPQSLQLADSTDPASWGSFDAAIERCRQHSDLAGVGFVFSADDSYCGVDLDDAIVPDTRALKAWAKQIVDLLASYTEISPSGNGVKIFLRGTKPGIHPRVLHQRRESNRSSLPQLRTHARQVG